MPVKNEKLDKHVYTAEEIDAKFEEVHESDFFQPQTGNLTMTVPITELQNAINALSRIILGTVSITVTGSAIDRAVLVTGFSGTGSLIITFAHPGGTGWTSTSAGAIVFTGCQCRVNLTIHGWSRTAQGYVSFSDCPHAAFSGLSVPRVSVSNSRLNTLREHEALITANLEINGDAYVTLRDCARADKVTLRYGGVLCLEDGPEGLTIGSVDNQNGHIIDTRTANTFPPSPLDTIQRRISGGLLNMNGYKITGLASPTAVTDAVPKSYVDAIATTIDNGRPPGDWVTFDTRYVYGSKYDTEAIHSTNVARFAVDADYGFCTVPGHGGYSPKWENMRIAYYIQCDPGFRLRCFHSGVNLSLQSLFPGVGGENSHNEWAHFTMIVERDAAAGVRARLAGHGRSHIITTNSNDDTALYLHNPSQQSLGIVAVAALTARVYV